MRKTTALVKLELCNIYGINVLRHIKDKNERKKKYALTAIIIFALLMAVSYVCSMVAALIKFGADKAVVPYLAVVSSVLSLIFSVLKAGGTIFRKNGYDIVSSLPLNDREVVFSRMFRMYIENLFLSLLIMLPGAIVYTVMAEPTPMFFVSVLAGMFFSALIPSATASVISTVILGISSRMKNKAIAETLISVILIICVLFSGPSFSDLSGEINEEKIKELLTVASDTIKKIYPPSEWLGFASEGKISYLFIFILTSVLIYAVIGIIISLNYRKICLRLFGTSAKHDYIMQEQFQKTAVKTLLFKEAKRYFSSGIYITNTIMGPVMALAMSIALIFADVEKLLPEMPINLSIMQALPFVLSAVLCMMPPSSASVSIEGKEWWILKSLPVSVKNIVNSKILFSILLLSPFYFISEMIFMIFQHIGMTDRLWLILVPFSALIFSCVFGIFINIKFPKMKWENETEVVKQSVSTAVGGIVPAFLYIIFGILSALTTGMLYNIICMAVIVILLSGAFFIYGKVCDANIQDIE